MASAGSALPFPSLAFLHRQIAELAEAPARQVRAGHVNLGKDIWLSCDPGGQAGMAVRPGGESGGFLLEVENGDSGRWCCLGMHLPARVLRQVRYAGLLVRLHSDSLVAYMPVLRYFRKAGGLQDAPAAEAVVMAPGTREKLSCIPVDAGLLEQADSCELNLFFESSRFSAAVARLEPLLIL